MQHACCAKMCTCMLIVCVVFFFLQFRDFSSSPLLSSPLLPPLLSISLSSDQCVLLPAALQSPSSSPAPLTQHSALQPFTSQNNPLGHTHTLSILSLLPHHSMLLLGSIIALLTLCVRASSCAHTCI